MSKKRQRPNITPASLPVSPAATTTTQIDYLSFSLRYLDGGVWKKTDKEERAAALDRIRMLSTTPFADIRLAPRHSLGFAHIDAASLHIPVPPGLTCGTASPPASFRFGQGKKAMVGVRVDSVFYVLCFEHSFGDAYAHR